MRYGSGEFTYEHVPGWAKLPSGWEWGHSSGIAVDAQDNVHVFTRSKHAVIVFDRSGNVISSWGGGLFGRAHGITITPDQMVYTTDDKHHVIRKFTLDGKLLQTIGTKDQPSDSGYIPGPNLIESLQTIKRGAGPFNRPTCVAVAPWGEMYVTDGYGNARVHRFTADGQLINSWGEPGHGPGEFFLPHSVVIDGRGRVVVMDRENERVQIFSRSGEFLEQWTDIAGPLDVSIDQAGRLHISHRHQSVSIRDLDGKTLAAFRANDVLTGQHSICVDSVGDIYVGEGSREPGYPSIFKFARVS